MTAMREALELRVEVTVYRAGERALLVRHGIELGDLSLPVLHWLGDVDSEEQAVVFERTPIKGVCTAAVLHDLLRHGFCAMDPYVHGRISARCALFGRCVRAPIQGNMESARTLAPMDPFGRRAWPFNSASMAWRWSLA